MSFDQSSTLSEEQARRFVVDATPWMSCDECFDHLDEYVELTDGERTSWLTAMSAHVSGCKACREEVESLLVLIGSDS